MAQEEEQEPAEISEDETLDDTDDGSADESDSDDTVFHSDDKDGDIDIAQ